MPDLSPFPFLLGGFPYQNRRPEKGNGTNLLHVFLLGGFPNPTKKLVGRKEENRYTNLEHQELGKKMEVLAKITCVSNFQDLVLTSLKSGASTQPRRPRISRLGGRSGGDPVPAPGGL